MIVRRAGEAGIPDGMTVMPVNDVNTWLKCAGLSYASLGSPTLATIVANAGWCASLMGSQNAMNYMIRSTAIQAAVLGSGTAVAALDSTDPFITPVMTGNAAPSGYSISISTGSWANESSAYVATQSSTSWFWYTAGSCTLLLTLPKQIWPYRITCNWSVCDANWNAVSGTGIAFYGSSDGNNWVSLTSGGGGAIILGARNALYPQYKVVFTKMTSTSQEWVRFHNFKIHGRIKEAAA